MIFGGEGVFFARLRGPGHVWLQSLPFSRLAGRIMANLGPLGRKAPCSDRSATSCAATELLRACNQGRISFAEFFSTNDSH
jgi:hypothetical protein